MLAINKKHGIVAIVGSPNAGKSTLTNALSGCKLAIVSPKVQTTRTALKAIISESDRQLIIIDTPGIFIPRANKILERVIAKTAWQSLREADHICLVIDSTIGVNNENKQIINDLKKEHLPITVILNKIDLVKKSDLLAIIANLQQLDFNTIFTISATQNDGIDTLKTFLLQQCNHPDFIYNDGEITTAPHRFLASEITREKLFLNLNQELPYHLTVLTDSYSKLADNSIKIHQTILISKNSQKTIILGKNGSMIKQISQSSREEISKLIGSKVHLFLFIKVKENWMQNIENFENFPISKLPK